MREWRVPTPRRTRATTRTGRLAWRTSPPGGATRHRRRVVGNLHRPQRYHRGLQRVLYTSAAFCISTRSCMKEAPASGGGHVSFASVDANGVERHHDPTVAGLVERAKVSPILLADAIGEGVIVVGLDFDVGPDLKGP